jgi:hypothetical protein
MSEPEDVAPPIREIAPPTAASDERLQRALADAIEAYAARVHEYGDFPPFPEGREVLPSDVAVTAAAILRAADVYSFEIAAMFNI